MDIYAESLEIHRRLAGKLEVTSKMKIRNKYDLSLAYTPGVAQACREIEKDVNQVYELTLKKNTIGIVSDGSAVLGLGNIGAHAAIPVMEGKAQIFKEFAGLDAFPICVETQDSREIVQLVRNIAPVFAGINLEDISAPRCFEIENALQDIGIPVFHDDQHGTAIVCLAALLNAAKLAEKKISELTVVISGAGAAGTAITKLLLCVDYEKGFYDPVKEILICDTKGILSGSRSDITNNPAKKELIRITNRSNRRGSLADALRGADVFIGVSAPDIVSIEMIRTMNPNPFIFAMSNPTPEIMPDLAKEAGAFIVATGRSDFPNQVNNALVFPGIFRGAIDVKAKRITPKMKQVAALALASCIENPTQDKILPTVFDSFVVPAIAKAVREAVV
ncbi:MAG: NADP-dependent malic enzyme [Candidatus Aureabacteria bacterium]|nr:NADP-dependent malic enzyme [Candidatus Auribacterota bacterium]